MLAAQLLPRLATLLWPVLARPLVLFLEGLSIYTLSGRGNKYSHMNCGIPGLLLPFMALSRSTIASMGRYINHAIYRISSINDPCNTQAKQDAHWAEAMRFVEACQVAGITPILETCTPQNLGSVSADQYRKALNDQARAGDGVDWLVIDVDAAVADTGTLSWQYLPAYNSGDNSHPTLTGYQAIDTVAAEPVCREFYDEKLYLHFYRWSRSRIVRRLWLIPSRSNTTRALRRAGCQSDKSVILEKSTIRRETRAPDTKRRDGRRIVKR